MEPALNFLHRLSEIRNPVLNTIFQLITRLGEEVVVLGIICLLYWCVNKNSAYKLGLIFFASGIAVQGLKVTFRIERPWILDPSFSPVESARPAATGYSFPSGHTQGATALYGYFADKTKKLPIKILFITLFLLVGFSRMYLGVHTPYDVLASLILTLIAVILIGRYYERIAQKNGFVLTIVLATISVALCIYSFVLSSIGYIDATQINDCFKSGGAGLGFAIGYYIERNYLNFDVRTDKLWKQILKFVIGVLGALFFKSVLKLISPGNLLVDFIRYLLTVLWVIALYPLIFSKILDKQNKKRESN